MRYLNRQDAGRKLAKVLSRFKGEDVVVLALPRGGIVLGLEVAKQLKAPLGLVLVRKIGHPSNTEYAIGAIAEDGEPIYDDVELAGVDKTWLDDAVDSARRLIKRRRELYYGDDFTAPDVTNKTVLLVDDGIATGLTVKAAVKAMRSKSAKQVIVAVPVAPIGSVDMLRFVADKVIVLDDPKNFIGSVGGHYVEFSQVNDEDVRAMLRMGET